ncbi:MAG: hypothetical protein K2K58_08100, partial [Muribaculaceae bacterium]|nr:hypothetical protein [Muribaculaceae bacterium]
KKNYRNCVHDDGHSFFYEKLKDAIHFARDISRDISHVSYKSYKSYKLFEPRALSLQPKAFSLFKIINKIYIKYLESIIKKVLILLN